MKQMKAAYATATIGCCPFLTRASSLSVSEPQVISPEMYLFESCFHSRKRRPILCVERALSTPTNINPKTKRPRLILGLHSFRTASDAPKKLNVAAAPPALESVRNFKVLNSVSSTSRSNCSQRVSMYLSRADRIGSCVSVILKLVICLTKCRLQSAAVKLGKVRRKKLALMPVPIEQFALPKISTNPAAS